MARGKVSGRSVRITEASDPTKGISEKKSSKADASKKNRKGNTDMGKVEKSTRKTGPLVDPPKPGCVVFVGRLPHGFYEDQLKAYFSQFGAVSRLRLSRNKRTGASKHYSFVEFVHPDVARIVVDTMHNYLLFGHVLQCKLVENSQLHECLFAGANRKFKKIPWAKIEAENVALKRKNGSLDTPAVVEKRLKDSMKKAKKAGIDYDFDGVVREVMALTN